MRINCSSAHQLCYVGEKWEVSSVQHCLLPQECFMSLLGLHVPVGSRCPQDWGPALHPGPVPRSSWSKLIMWRGWKEASAFIGKEIFAQSIPEVTALDSSVSWALPVSVLFGLYMDYLNPLHLWLILQHIWPAYKNLAGLTHSKKVWKRVNVTNTKLLCPEHATLLALGSQDCVTLSIPH